MAASINISNTMKQTGWANRKESLFIDGIIRSNGILNRMTIIDGVKDKAQIPTRDASIQWGNDICDLTAGGDGSLSLGDKEVTVADFTWYFSNCKKTLEGTYRSALLRKGANNDQTLDDSLKEWLFDFFAKKNAEKALIQSVAELRPIILAENGVVKITYSANIASAGGVLDKMKAMYKGMTKDMRDTFFGETDKEFKPVYFMNTATYQQYQIEMADKYTTTPEGIIKGDIPPFMGIEVDVYSALEDGEILLTPPANLLLITDDFGDVGAIQYEYEKLGSKDQFFGNFKLGFNVRRGDMIVASLKTVTTTAEK